MKVNRIRFIELILSCFFLIVPRNLQYPKFLRQIAATNAPFLRIKIVSPVADIFHEAQRDASISKQHEPASHRSRKYNSFFAQISYRLLIANVLNGKSAVTQQHRAQCQRMSGNQISPFHFTHRHTGLDHFQILSKCFQLFQTSIGKGVNGFRIGQKRIVADVPHLTPGYVHQLFSDRRNSFPSVFPFFLCSSRYRKV